MSKYSVQSIDDCSYSELQNKKWRDKISALSIEMPAVDNTKSKGIDENSVIKHKKSTWTKLIGSAQEVRERASVFFGKYHTNTTASHHPDEIPTILSLPVSTKSKRFDEFRLKVMQITTSSITTGIISFFIFVNLIITSVETYSLGFDKAPYVEMKEINGYKEYEASKQVDHEAGCMIRGCNELEMFFLIVFSIELLMNLLVHLHKFIFDRWLLFDFLVVVISWIPYISKTMDFETSYLRTFRAFRLFGRIKALNTIMNALVSTFERLTSILFVLVLFIFIFAVFFTQIVGKCWQNACYCGDIPDKCLEQVYELQSNFVHLDDENYEDQVNEILGPNYFGTLWRSVETLIAITTLEGWYNNTYLPTRRFYGWPIFIPFIVFIFISSFMILNLIVAVLCEAIGKIGRREDMMEEMSDDGSSISSIRDSGRIKSQDGLHSRILIRNNCSKKSVGNKDDILNLSNLIEDYKKTELKLKELRNDYQTQREKMMKIELQMQELSDISLYQSSMIQEHVAQIGKGLKKPLGINL